VNHVRKQGFLSNGVKKVNIQLRLHTSNGVNSAEKGCGFLKYRYLLRMVAFLATGLEQGQNA